MLTDKQRRLQEVLDKFAASPGILGAVLVSRDGFCMLNRYKALPGAETFSAMSATLVGAAEAALAETGLGSASRIIVETPTHRMVTVGATGELLLVGIAESSKSIEELIQSAGSAASEVAKVISG